MLHDTAQHRGETDHPAFPSVGTSLDCPNSWNTMGSGSATSSTSSLRTYGCISVPTSLCIGCLDGLKTDLIPQLVVLHSASPCLCLCSVGSVARTCASEDRGKTITEYLSFLHVLSNQVPHPLPEWTHFSLFFLLSLYLEMLFLMPLTSLARTNSIKV